MLKTKRSTLFRIINLILTVGLFYFAFIYVRELVRKADFNGLSGHYPLLVLAFLLFILFYAALSWHWLLVCRLVREDVRRKQALAFTASQPYKYLPTSLFTFSYRAKFAKQLGLPVKDSSYAQVIENFDIIAGGALVCLISWLMSVSYALGFAALALSLLAMYAVRFMKPSVTVPRMSLELPLYRLVLPFLLVMSAWVISGLSFLLVNRALGLHPDAWMVIAANAGAYAASILAFFAPGGIGIREVVLAAFSIANAPIILWRLLTFAADMTLGFASLIYVQVLR